MHVLLRETDARPMPHGLSDRIARIKREFRLTKGVWLTDDQAFAELDRIDAEGTIPELVRRDLAKVEALLTALNYDRDPKRLALLDIQRCGTAQCTPWLDDEDRDAVEALLDSHPDWNRGEWGPEYGDATGEDRFAGSEGYAGLAVRGRAVAGVFRD